MVLPSMLPLPFVAVLGVSVGPAVGSRGAWRRGGVIGFGLQFLRFCGAPSRLRLITATVYESACSWSPLPPSPSAGARHHGFLWVLAARRVQEA